MADAELDGAAERRGRGPRDISSGRLRQNMFPQPSRAMEENLMRYYARGPAVNHGPGDLELGEAVNLNREVSPGEGPSNARATGRQVDLEGQRQRRWTTEDVEVEDMD